MIDLPPRRALPPQLRDKMLVELRQKLDAPPRRSKVPYAVAAGVAALVAGGVVAASALNGGDTTDTASGKLTGDTKGVVAEAQRCMAASTKVGGFPTGAGWRVAAHTAMAGYTELAIRVDDKPVFCEVTGTKVTLTKFGAKPNYVSGSRTGTVFQGESKLIGLVVDPSWGGIDAYEKTGKDEIIDSAPTQPGTTGWRYADGMALWWPEYQVAMTVAPKGTKPTSPLPAAPKSTVTVIDRPYTGPAPDRTSPEGKVLAKCIESAKARNPLADPETWQPGPLLSGDPESILVIRGPELVTSCLGKVNSSRPGDLWIGWWGGDQREVRLPTTEQPVLAPTTDYLQTAGKGQVVVVYGAVPRDAASMTVTTDKHKTYAAKVLNGSFGLTVPASDAPLAGDPVITSVTVKDSHGKIVYQGKPAGGESF